MRKSMEGFTMLFVYSFLFSILRTSTTLDTVTPTQSIKDGETLVSAGRNFELGFFSPVNSLKSRYLGIWYKKLISTQTVVWVANRETPLFDPSGVLNITGQGILVLLNSTKHIVWSSNRPRTAKKNPVAQLLDSGNLVVKDGNDNNPANFLWQSFDYPCDTLLPGMKLGWNSATGLDRFLTPWKSTEDPAPGNYSFRIYHHGFPQLLLMKGPIIKFRSGSWNGLRFTGTPALKLNPLYKFEFVLSETEVYYMYMLQNSSVVTRTVVEPSGLVQRFTWIDRTQRWELFFTAQVDQCDEYGLCGAYGSCNISNSPVCGCLEGFVPKSPRDWSLVDWSDGCVRRTPLDCNNGDDFLKYTAVKLPDTSRSWFDKSMSLEKCREMCLKNCSCSAYANSDVREGGRGCLLWFDDLIDIRTFTEIGQDFYIRMAASEIGDFETNRHSSEKKKVGIIVSCVILIMGVLILGLILYIRKKKLRNQGKMKGSREKDYRDEGGKEDSELQIFDLTTIANATNNFSSDNKLGEGGFGPVYKGTLIEGQEIAVKRLSKSSGQGPNEFKNEVILISRLQHRNLVKLLGCCIQGDEKMLIYEFMPNKSLDFFIFDQTRSTLLDWHKCIHIIGGIARGLLYLHQDSRLRIIHRDLKASNVLLDKDMNPKISDFGMARIFGGDQTEANTNTVVGTYGYMSPEYAIDGLFSMKSDVFSFGVLVLEIVSGKKNRGFNHSNHNLNLLGHAWRLWIEGRPLELTNKLLGDSSALSDQVLRCIHVGLLCVQQRPEDRPSMSSVVLMLGSENSLPQPKQPGFFTERNFFEKDSSSSKQDSSSTNEITFTTLEPR